MDNLIKRYQEMKQQHPGVMLLFRVGDFYEMFSDDAKDASNILGITLTRRANGAAQHVEIAAFPHYALDTCLPKLVRAGCRVAIFEQRETPQIDQDKIQKEASLLIADFLYDQGGKKEELGKAGKQLLGEIETIAAKFYKHNPDLVGDKDFRMEMTGGDVDELKANYGDREGFKQLNSLLEKWYDSDIFDEEANASESPR